MDRGQLAIRVDTAIGRIVDQLALHGASDASLLAIRAAGHKDPDIRRLRVIEAIAGAVETMGGQLSGNSGQFDPTEPIEGIEVPPGGVGEVGDGFARVLSEAMAAATQFLEGPLSAIDEKPAPARHPRGRAKG